MRRYAALVVVFVGCGNPPAAARRERPPPLVRTLRVTPRALPVELGGPVDLRPLAQADIGAKTAGYLDAVLVDRGDRVHRGQLLALVRPSDLPDQLGAARGTLSQVRSSVVLAEASVARARSLAPSGVVSQQELQAAEATLATAHAAEESARAQIAALGTRLSEMRITSPMDGVVLSRRLDPGALVGPQGSGAILTVARTDVLRAFVSVAERDSAQLSTGAEARVVVDARPDASFHGTVARIAPSFDPVTRMLEAEVHLPNAGGLLRPGMFGRASIRVGTHPDAITVPPECIRQSSGTSSVFRVRDGRAQRVTVTTGIDGGDWIEITQGLAAGDEIIVAGADGLSDAAPVRVAPPAGARPAGTADAGRAPGGG